ncbi:glycoside hydrolase family 19 protein [Acinetobacter rudis]|uniref:glycoside hydrolase family 19 protein n=1 Tax=Acinetobacter rudis TaxID=632955 RepID=UPI00333E872D
MLFSLVWYEADPKNDYRGRGLIHLTHFETYVRCAKETGLDIEKNPELLQTDYNAAIESATWFWKDNNINKVTKNDNSKINDERLTNKVTVIVNPGMKKAKERRD